MGLSTLIALALSLLPAQQPPKPAVTPQVAVEATASGWAVTVTRATGDALGRGKVPFTAEPYTMSVRFATGEIDERDLFGSGLSADVDGDGQTTSVLQARCDGRRAIVGAATLEPLGTSWATMTYRAGGRSRVAQIGDKGARAVLYRDCGDGATSFGFAPAGQPLKIHEVAGPALQILVIEPVAKAGQAPSVALGDLRAGGAKLKTKPFVSWTYEDLGGPGAEWAAVTWLVIPLRGRRDPTVRFTVRRTGPRPAGAGPILVVAMPQSSPRPGVRRRHQPASARLL